MGKLKDITGERFGRLVVVERVENDSNGQAMWLCQCDCGSEPKVIRGSQLRNGKISSCGCFHKEQLSDFRTTHGMAKCRLYRIWKNMKQRCCNKNHPRYLDYGGRGITVCDEWVNDFTSFREWANSAGYNDGLSIDRIDVNSGYSPDNCRWADNKTQQNNRTTNHYITINNNTKTLREWCDEYKISYVLVRDRINKLGWNPIVALTTQQRGAK